jgi:hypothetical protein
MFELLGNHDIMCSNPITLASSNMEWRTKGNLMRGGGYGMILAVMMMMMRMLMIGGLQKYMMFG